jgi:putative Mg2+ transporter-C (MgtC) family protein
MPSTVVSAVRLDPARVAAQIVTGIGFLGAGAILKDGALVRGMTTAACLWVAAGIGMAVGVGLYIPSLAVTVLALGSLLFLKKMERRLVAGALRQPDPALRGSAGSAPAGG